MNTIPGQSVGALSASDFEFMRTFVRDKSGIIIGADKQYLVESRLSPLLRLKNIRSFGELISMLRQPSAAPLIKSVIDAMTTNETFFFRDMYPFEALQKHVLPQMIAARSASKTLSIWCAAASSGQEPYSLAMILKEHFSVALQGWRVQISATDISADMIARCKAGLYSPIEVSRGLPPDLLVKHFTKNGNEWQIRDELRKAIVFEEMNLLDNWSHSWQMDIIFCRNVLIYFDDDTKRKIFARMRSLLRPDGWLFLGGAETALNLDDHYERAPLDRAGAFRIRRT